MGEYTDSQDFGRPRNSREFFTTFLLKQLIPASIFSFILTLAIGIFVSAAGSALINVISPDLLTALMIMIVMPVIILFYFVLREIRMRIVKQHIGELEDAKKRLSWFASLIRRNLQSPISNLQSPISNLQSPISNLQLGGT